MQRMQSTRSRILPSGLLLAIIGIATLGVAAILWTTGIIHGADNDATPHRIILYSDATISSIMTDERAVAAGFVVVHSFDALKRDVDRSTRAIIISDPGQTDQDWIRNQYNSGVMVGALNTSRDKMAATIGDRSEIPYPPNEFPAPYVVLASRVSCPNGHIGRGMLSVPLGATSNPAGALAQTIETKLRLNDYLCAATPPVSTVEGR